MESSVMRLFIFLIFLAGDAWAQVDRLATMEARVLHQKLFRLSRDLDHGKIIYGHQNAFTEGRGWRVQGNADWAGSLPESDLHKAFGRDPGVVGYDFSEVGEGNEVLWAKEMRALHAKGGIVTLSWHMPNFDSSGKDSNAWDTGGGTVGRILNDPSQTQLFYQKLDRLVHFLKRVKSVPIIFRPWHEHNYFWFWWGDSHCTPFEYQKLWRLTVRYLWAQGVHNLLFAYSPNNVERNYFERYPGDAYVDIFGVDMYFKGMAENFYFFGPSPLDEWKKDVLQLMNSAEAHGKIPAITEFGNESISYFNFWTDYFSWPIEREGMKQFSERHSLQMPRVKAAYALLWRNDKDSPTHFFSPFPGAPGNANFQSMLSKGVFGFLGDF